MAGKASEFGVVSITRLSEIADWRRLEPEIDAIFFAASATKSFASPVVRKTFHECWLGRFLDRFPDATFLARDGQGAVLGYITGALADPAREPLFADIGYFQQLATLTARFPAHLHINLGAAARNLGIGGRLIETFCDHAQKNGARGVHAVTSEASRNRSFYARMGFVCEATILWGGHPLVFLARPL